MYKNECGILRNEQYGRVSQHHEPAFTSEESQPDHAIRAYRSHVICFCFSNLVYLWNRWDIYKV